MGPLFFTPRKITLHHIALLHIALRHVALFYIALLHLRCFTYIKAGPGLPCLA